MSEFKPTIENIKAEIESYSIDKHPATCTDEQAEKLLYKWNDLMTEMFCEFIRNEYIDGEILNESDEEE